MKYFLCGHGLDKLSLTNNFFPAFSILKLSIQHLTPPITVWQLLYTDNEVYQQENNSHSEVMSRLIKI